MVSEDLDRIGDFDEKNYQNRKYNSNNFEQGEKFFKLRYIKSKLNSLQKNKLNEIFL